MWTWSLFWHWSIIDEFVLGLMSVDELCRSPLIWIGIVRTLANRPREWFACTAKNQYRKLETNIPRKGIAQPQPQFPHSCIRERFIYYHDRFAYSVTGNMWTDPGNIFIAHRHTNVVFGTEAAQFSEMEYINGIFVEVWTNHINFQVTKPGRSTNTPLHQYRRQLRQRSYENGALGFIHLEDRAVLVQ